MIRKRTQAQRDAINARAVAWPRPLSRMQRQALDSMARAPQGYVRGIGTWGYCADATIQSLVRRGLCRIEGKQRMRAVITGSGRRVLKV